MERLNHLRNLTPFITAKFDWNRVHWKRWSSRKPVMTLETMNPRVKTMQYAVRGPIPIRALAIEKELLQGAKKPFNSVIKANIGDAHAMGQRPITFTRQVLCLVSYPQIMGKVDFPDDVKFKARAILEACKGSSVGSYSDSAGIKLIRDHAAEFISKRDGGIPSHSENIVLFGGASDAIRATLKLFRSVKSNPKEKCGVLVPIPQYPLYSASITLFGLHQIGYYLDEPNAWGLDMNELQRAVKDARDVCVPQAIVIINPGNPTGQVLSRANIEQIIKFAYEERLFILADEVYQDNVYGQGDKFFSFKQVMMELGPPYNQVELASYFSTSKGYMGECGLRGGYAEFTNLDPDVFAMLIKSVSAKLCPTVIGQATLDCVVSPPERGDPSYDLFIKEKTQILKSLKDRAKLTEATFNSIPGIKCNTVQGAMYAFPKIQIPPKAIEAAKAKGQAPDEFYAFELLETTGICIIPGSGFGQIPGTYHFRTTILPQPELLSTMLEKFRTFHANFLSKYS